MRIHRVRRARDCLSQPAGAARGGSAIALTIGNFDGVHLGHQAMLRRLAVAAAAHQLPACVMTFEPHPREFFAPAAAPARLSNVREKLLLFEQFGVQEVFLCRFNDELAQLSAAEFLDIVFTRFGARWLLVGDDFRFGAHRGGDTDMLRARGGAHGARVESMASVALAGLRVSSTAVREALERGDLERARALLGRSYRMCGRVAHGAKLGRSLGFPTANVLLKRARAPLSGIFAVKLHGLGDVKLGAASLGVRPTVSDSLRPSLEVHLLDFQRDIYGAHVQVEFCRKLRDEEKYPSLEALRAQIALDVENAREYFRQSA